MKCPNCQSNKIRKNGHRRGKQNYHCKKCDRQFIDRYTARGYSTEVQENCLKMYLNGLGFRAIERVTGVNHNTVIRWVKKSAVALPNAPRVEEIPEIRQIDELRSLCRSKKTRYGSGQQLTIGNQACSLRRRQVASATLCANALRLSLRRSRALKPLSHYGRESKVGNHFCMLPMDG